MPPPQVRKGVVKSPVVRTEGGLAGRGRGEGGLQGVERVDRHGEGEDADGCGGQGAGRPGFLVIIPVS